MRLCGHNRKWRQWQRTRKFAGIRTLYEAIMKCCVNLTKDEIECRVVVLRTWHWILVEALNKSAHPLLQVTQIFWTFTFQTKISLAPQRALQIVMMCYQHISIKNLTLFSFESFHVSKLIFNEPTNASIANFYPLIWELGFFPKVQLRQQKKYKILTKI